jgi:hypothetical protein
MAGSCASRARVKSPLVEYSRKDILYHVCHASQLTFSAAANKTSLNQTLLGNGCATNITRGEREKERERKREREREREKERERERERERKKGKESEKGGRQTGIHSSTLLAHSGKWNQELGGGTEKKPPPHIFSIFFSSIICPNC